MKTNIILVFLVSIILSCKDKIKNSNQEEIHTATNYETNLNNNSPQLEKESVNYTSTIDDETQSRDCSETHSAADDAYTNCRKAYNSDDFDEVKSYLKKAMNNFDDAMSSAADCKCDDAHSSAEEGYGYAKKGYRSDDFEDVKRYAKKAKNSAEETMTKADDCKN